MESWRCFVAVPLGDALRATLAGAVEPWRLEPVGPDLRWTDADSWHVTLNFLGPMQPTAIPGLIADLHEAVATQAPFTVATGGLGTFPGSGRARSVWYGLTDADGRLATLAAAVGAPNPLQAHVTLARVRMRYGTRLTEWLDGRAVPPGTIEVGHIELLRSHLGEGPARYEVLASVPLGGAGSVDD